MGFSEWAIVRLSPWLQTTGMPELADGKMEKRLYLLRYGKILELMTHSRFAVTFDSNLPTAAVLFERVLYQGFPKWNSVMVYFYYHRTNTYTTKSQSPRFITSLKRAFSAKSVYLWQSCWREWWGKRQRGAENVPFFPHGLFAEV